VPANRRLVPPRAGPTFQRTAEVGDVTSSIASKSNAAIEVDSLSLTDTSATGAITATAASSSGTLINQTGSAIVVRPAPQ